MISQASHRSRIRVESLRGDLKSSLYLAFRSEYFIIRLIPQSLELGRRGAAPFEIKTNDKAALFHSGSPTVGGAPASRALGSSTAGLDGAVCRPYLSALALATIEC